MSRTFLPWINRSLSSSKLPPLGCNFSTSLSQPFNSPRSLQILPSSHPNPLYHLLPPTQNPSQLVDLICTSLKRPDCDLSVLRNNLGNLLPRLNTSDIGRVLLRCQSDYASALTFFNWVKNDLCIVPGVYNYCLVLHILSWSRQLGQAMELMTELFKSVRNEIPKEDVFRVLVVSSEECYWDPVVFDILIKAYLKIGSVREAFRTFLKTTELGFAPSVISCNFLIDRLLKVNDIEQCWVVYGIMGRVGIHPNSHTFNILTNVLCREGDVDKVNEFLERMEEEGFDPDIVTYNTLLRSYCRKGRLEDAFRLYSVMSIRRVNPDLVSHTTLINGLCRADRVREAHNLFNQMLHDGLDPDGLVYSTLIYTYCKEGNMKESKLLLREMIGRRIFPDDFTCRVMMEGYGREGNLISAINLVVELERLGVPLSKEIYDHLIISLCDESRPFAAKNFLDRICAEGYVPSMCIYYKLIEALCSNDSVDEALILKAEMIEKGKLPNLGSYKSLIGSLTRTGRSKEGELLMEEMNGLGVMPDHEICRALIHGFCKEKNVARAESILETFAAKFGVIDHESCNALIWVIAEDGDANALMELQNRILKMGYAPNRTSYKYIILGICKAATPHKGKLHELWICRRPEQFLRPA
ncbi:hypothetical protein SAY87_007244 [Trapa incisa]|uniref:Pentatricopeptide repeat-containing protein n=1 Tax=Trapa incisa TaxID=236973 RepID=A0AAN7K2I8_9MYRT|nr:hypothetical protein SAY87_007244 [Trapa incisa]